MNKPVLGMLVGAGLGILDGSTALVSAPELSSEIAGILIGSMGKGLVAGLVMGLVARKVNNLAIGIGVGLLVGAALAYPIAIAQQSNGQVYFWEIIIPGSIVGVIVGFATQRYGAPSARRSGV